MHQIKYKSTISYTDFDGSCCSMNYQIYASDKDDANKISRELFFMDYGVASDMHVDIEPVLPKTEELNRINKKFPLIYNELKKTYVSMTYKSFLKAFENFEGKHLTMYKDCVSFVLNFRGITCKVIYNNLDGSVYIDENEIVFRLDNRDYIIRDNLSSVYIGG